MDDGGRRRVSGDGGTGRDDERESAKLLALLDRRRPRPCFMAISAFNKQLSRLRNKVKVIITLELYVMQAQACTTTDHAIIN